MTAVLRDGEKVTPLELFFDLVFVLAITQCTALMAAEPTWEGLAKGLLVLGVLWWAWVGYAWLTSVVDPEEGTVRLAIFAAMAALLVVALCVPEAFEDLGLTFALFYGVFRLGQLVLFLVASRDDAGAASRRCGSGLVPSTLRRRVAAGGGQLRRRAGPGWRCGRRPCRWTSWVRTCSDPRDGSWFLGTSPSATGSSSSWPWASRSSPSAWAPKPASTPG